MFVVTLNEENRDQVEVSATDIDVLDGILCCYRSDRAEAFGSVTVAMFSRGSWLNVQKVD